MKFTFQILGNHTKTKIMNKDKIMKRLYNFMTKQVGLLEKMKNNIQLNEEEERLSMNMYRTVKTIKYVFISLIILLLAYRLFKIF